MSYVIGGINMGNLPDYLFFFSDGSKDANWQGASKGFLGDVAVDGVQADERTSGFVPYAGTIYTNDTTLGAWQNIVNDNAGQAFASYNQTARISGLETDLASAFSQINALPPTPGFESVSAASLDGLNTQDGINKVYVINVTSGFNISSQIDITGDPGDVYILRWDEDANPANGYQGQVKFQSGGAIVPHGGLTPANFINVAGDINSSGGGSNPPAPYPQGPRYDNGAGDLIDDGQDWNGGGFFTGYWLTTGDPKTRETSSLSNAIFVGGWYTSTIKFSMTSGTSGVHITPNAATFPQIDVEKEVSNDGGLHWFDADQPPGPNVLSPTNPLFRFTVKNTGNVTLTNVVVTDTVYGPPPTPIGTVPSMVPGASVTFPVVAGMWALGGPFKDTATAVGTYNNVQVTDTDPAWWTGVAVPTPAVDLEKEVSPNGGVTWFDADGPTGPFVDYGTNPQFKFTVTNTGNVILTNVVVTDTVYGPPPTPIGVIPVLAIGATVTFPIVTGVWAEGQQHDTATVTSNEGATDTDPAYWFGFAAPAIDVEKLVSPDGGVTWFDADDPLAPVPVVSPTNPQFMFIVTNTGNVPLSNVTVTDTDYTLTGVPTTLAIGESVTLPIVTGTWALGEHHDTASASGTFESTTVDDSDPAYWDGVQAAEPSIDVEKEVSPNNGLTWFDADDPLHPILVNYPTNPQFRFTVTNTGNITLTNVVVTDSVYGPPPTPIGVIPILAIGETVIFDPPVTGTWAAGLQQDLVTATSNEGATDTDPAYWFGAQPVLTIEKYVSIDNGATWLEADTPPGPLLPAGVTPQYKIVVTNNGNVDLTNITITDTEFGTIGTLPTLAIGASFTVFKP